MNLRRRTGCVSALRLLLAADGPLARCWSDEHLRALPPHLETAKRQAAEPLGLAWFAQDFSSAAALLLEGCG